MCYCCCCSERYWWGVFVGPIPQRESSSTLDQTRSIRRFHRPYPPLHPLSADAFPPVVVHQTVRHRTIAYCAATLLLPTARCCSTVPPWNAPSPHFLHTPPLQCWFANKTCCCCRCWEDDCDCAVVAVVVVRATTPMHPAPRSHPNGVRCAVIWLWLLLLLL